MELADAVEKVFLEREVFFFFFEVREGRRVSRRAGAGERRKKTEENADALEVVSSSPSLSLPLDSRRSSRERELIFAASAREGDAHA